MYILFLKQNKLVIGLNSAFIHGKNFLEESSSESIPPGVICIWSGASTNIPDGWHLCDGTNNTPDLRDKFVLGSGNKYSVGNTGGEETHTLTINEMPSHSHSGSIASSGSHKHSIKLRVSYGVGGSINGIEAQQSTAALSSIETYNIQNSGTHTHSMSLNNAGNSQPHNNMPPYYALCFIMKL